MEHQSIFVTLTLVTAFAVHSGCTGTPPYASGKADAPAVAAMQAPEIVSLHPAGTVAGTPFNRQPNGGSAIAIKMRNARKTSTIYFNDRALPTVYGGPELLSAEVPEELYKKRRRFDVAVADGQLRSNSLPFEVDDK